MLLAQDILVNVITSTIEIDISNNLNDNYGFKNEALSLLWYAHCLLNNKFYNATQQNIAIDALNDAIEPLILMSIAIDDKKIILESLDDVISDLSKNLKLSQKSKSINT